MGQKSVCKFKWRLIEHYQIFNKWKRRKYWGGDFSGKIKRISLWKDIYLQQIQSIKMDKKDLKSLDNNELKQVYADVHTLTQSQLDGGINVDFENISYLYSIENEIRLRGMVVKDAVVQSRKTAKNTTREERTMRRIGHKVDDLDRRKANRKKFSMYILVGAFLCLMGVVFTMTNERYIYLGAIFTGIGVIIIGIHGLSTEKYWGAYF